MMVFSLLLLEMLSGLYYYRLFQVKFGKHRILLESIKTIARADTTVSFMVPSVVNR